MGPLADYLLAGLVAVAAGIDRTAALQVMLSRPLVAAPLTGWVLGDPGSGLLVGMLVELLWLGRLPVGAAIPPDDTQVAVGATTLAAVNAPLLGLSGAPFTLLCLLVTIPLGKVGQLFDRGARHWNVVLLARTETALHAGAPPGIARHHLAGLVHFGLASLATYAFIVGVGSVLLPALARFHPLVSGAAGWLQMAFPLVGAAVILGTLNVSRAMTLFCTSFATALLALWLAR